MFKQLDHLVKYVSNSVYKSLEQQRNIVISLHFVLAWIRHCPPLCHPKPHLLFTLDVFILINFDLLHLVEMQLPIECKCVVGLNLVFLCSSVMRYRYTCVGGLVDGISRSLSSL